MTRDQPTPPRYDDLPDLCTPEDARAFLQVGRNAIYDLLKSGEIHYLKYGHRIRIPKAALLKTGNGNGK